MLLTNGRIHVMDADLSIVDTVVVHDGRIAFVGRRADISAGVGEVVAARARASAPIGSGAYAWRSLLDTGTIIAGGSDFPVEDANPFHGLHAASRVARSKAIIPAGSRSSA